MTSRPALLVLVRHGQSQRNIAKRKNRFFLDDEARRPIRGIPDHLIGLTDLGWRPDAPGAAPSEWRSAEPAGDTPAGRPRPGSKRHEPSRPTFWSSSPSPIRTIPPDGTAAALIPLFTFFRPGILGGVRRKPDQRKPVQPSTRRAPRVA